MTPLVIAAFIGQALALAAEYRKRHLRIHRNEWMAEMIISTVFVAIGGAVCLS